MIVNELEDEDHPGSPQLNSERIVIEGGELNPEGKYTVMEELGHGAFANVFDCKEEATGKRFACKLFQNEFAE